MVIVKFHYTGPTGPARTRADPNGPARTLSETRTDPTEFLGDPGRKKIRAGPVGPAYWNLAITDAQAAQLRLSGTYCRKLSLIVTLLLLL